MSFPLTSKFLPLEFKKFKPLNEKVERLNSELGRRDSNPDRQNQNLLRYHYATSQSLSKLARMLAELRVQKYGKISYYTNFSFTFLGLLPEM